MFIPVSRKFQKNFKIRPKKLKLVEKSVIKLIYGQFGIKAISYGILTTKHFILLRMLIKRNLKKKHGTFYFPKKPYTFKTKKPQAVRMGKGKGSLDQWVCPIKIGQIILEFKFRRSVKKNKRLIILRKCMKRLPMKTIIITKKLKKISYKFYKDYKFLTYGLY